MVGDTGFEPVTSSVSRKRAPTAPIARAIPLSYSAYEVETGFEPVYTALQAVASPLGHSTEVTPRATGRPPSGRRDSNPRPSPWQGDALPAALRPRAPSVFRRRMRTLAQSGRRCQTGYPARRHTRPAAPGRPAHPGRAPEEPNGA